jgi:hypothetical protein
VDWLTRRARWVAIVIALCTYAAAIAFGTWTAGGSDSFGYVSQSARWLDGTLIEQDPLSTSQWPAGLPGPRPPLGYVEYHGGDAIVPIYAAGLPLIMAAFRIVAGECGPYLVSPIFAALAVLAVYLLGAFAGSKLLGLAAAGWLACSPVFIYMSMWPMTDVPVATAWTFSLLFVLKPGLVSRTAAGLAAGIAILIRPNLIAVLPLMAIAVVILERRRSGSRRAFLEAAVFGAAALPGIAIAAAVQHVLYGAPWRSGYGSLDALYRIDNILPNAISYAGRMIKTQSPLILLAVPALAGAGVRGSLFQGRPVRLAATLFVIGMWGSYLSYGRFDEWWYLRFLLPVFPMLIVLALVPVWTALQTRPLTIVLPLAWVALLGLCLYELDVARNGQTFRLQGEQRYQSVGAFVHEHLPENAVILSMQHSGSVRYYSGRLTVWYRAYGGAELPRALAALEELGYRPYILLEDWEVPEFVSRFRSAGPVGSLDVARVARHPKSIGVTIYDPQGPPALAR